MASVSSTTEKVFSVVSSSLDTFSSGIGYAELIDGTE